VFGVLGSAILKSQFTLILRLSRTGFHAKAANGRNLRMLFGVRPLFDSMQPNQLTRKKCKRVDRQDDRSDGRGLCPLASRKVSASKIEPRAALVRRQAAAPWPVIFFVPTIDLSPSPRWTQISDRTGLRLDIDQPRSSCAHG